LSFRRRAQQSIRDPMPATIFEPGLTKGRHHMSGSQTIRAHAQALDPSRGIVTNLSVDEESDLPAKFTPDVAKNLSGIHPDKWQGNRCRLAFQPADITVTTSKALLVDKGHDRDRSRKRLLMPEMPPIIPWRPNRKTPQHPISAATNIVTRMSAWAASCSTSTARQHTTIKPRCPM